MPAKKPNKKSQSKLSTPKRVTTLSNHALYVQMQMALAMFIGITKVGVADGDSINEKETAAALTFSWYLASDSKSEYTKGAAKLLVKGDPFVLVSTLRKMDARADEKILLELSKILKELPREDFYWFFMAFHILCVGVGMASGGGFLKGPAFSSEEEAVVAEMDAALWGMPAPLSLPVPPAYIAFSLEAKAYWKLYGI